MSIMKVLALVAVSFVATAGMASAASQGGTPDAAGGAVGRDQPSSLDGRGVRRSAGLTSRAMMMKRHHYRHHRRHAI